MNCFSNYIIDCQFLCAIVDFGCAFMFPCQLLQCQIFSSGSKYQIISIMYRIFSIKCPRHLFKTWPQGLGVYLKPAFNRGPAFNRENTVCVFSVGGGGGGGSKNILTQVYRFARLCTMPIIFLLLALKDLHHIYLR